MMGVQPVPYAQYTDALVPLDGEQRDETTMLLQLASACGSNLFGSRAVSGVMGGWRSLAKVPVVGRLAGYTPERLLGLMARVFGLGSLNSLRSDAHGRLLEPNEGGDFLGQRVVTDDGLMDLAPPEFVEAAQRLDEVFEQERAQRHRLKLVSKREQHSHNSWLHNHPKFVEGRRHTNYLYMNPQDAQSAGVQTGDTVEVSSDVATTRLPVQVTDEMMVGAVALPHGWGHQAADGLSVAKDTGGANVNLLAADGPERLEFFSGMAQLNGILVDVRRVASPEGGE